MEKKKLVSFDKEFINKFFHISAQDAWTLKSHFKEYLTSLKYSFGPKVHRENWGLFLKKELVRLSPFKDVIQINEFENSGSGWKDVKVTEELKEAIVTSAKLFIQNQKKYSFLLGLDTKPDISSLKKKRKMEVSEEKPQIEVDMNKYIDDEDFEEYINELKKNCDEKVKKYKEKTEEDYSGIVESMKLKRETMRAVKECREKKKFQKEFQDQKLELEELKKKMEAFQNQQTNKV